MGNEQSTPTPRGPRNKLSKPRTNSSINASNVRGSVSAPPSRRNSQSNHVATSYTGVVNDTYSILSGEAVVGNDGEKKRGEPTSKKRMSIFRSKSSQAKVQQLDIGSAADIEYLDQGSENWTRRTPVTEDLKENRHYSVPIEKYDGIA